VTQNYGSRNLSFGQLKSCTESFLLFGELERCKDCRVAEERKCPQHTPAVFCSSHLQSLFFPAFISDYTFFSTIFLQKDCLMKKQYPIFVTFPSFIKPDGIVPANQPLQHYPVTRPFILRGSLPHSTILAAAGKQPSPQVCQADFLIIGSAYA
jgi:hypothetical protein